MKTLSSFKGSPPKRGIGICLIVMFAMMVSFSSSTFAAAAPDVPDVTKTAVQESPGSSVEFQLIVNDVAKARSAFDGQQLMVKSTAVSQDVRIDDLAAAKAKEESIDLQALVPPLISVKEEMRNVHKIMPEVKSPFEVPNQLETMEVSTAGDIVSTSANLMGWRMTDCTKERVMQETSLIPEVQLKRPIQVNSNLSCRIAVVVA